MNLASPLQIGDYAKIIGPNSWKIEAHLGEIFQIHSITDRGCAGKETEPYPATSLRKVRVVDEGELQIGDWVEVIGPGYGQSTSCENCRKGQTIRIVKILPGGLYIGESGPWYLASSLRKLTPDEIPQPKIELPPEAKKKINAAILKIIDKGENLFDEFGEFIELQMEQNEEFDKRLSAIESKLADISPKDRQFSPGETVGEAFQGHLDKINEVLEPLAEEIRKDPGFLSKSLDERLQEIQAFNWSSGVGGESMTDSPINLDEAHSIIAEGKARHAKYPGIDRLEYYIEYRYLESIVSELEAGRQRITDLESQVNDNQGNIDDAFEMGCKKVGCIIPQAEDAKLLHKILRYVEAEEDAIYCDTTEEEELLKRYLAAIEGGKP